jgi:hypothetical protein
MWDLATMKVINLVALEKIKRQENQSDALRVLTDLTRKEEAYNILEKVKKGNME